MNIVANQYIVELKLIDQKLINQIFFELLVYQERLINQIVKQIVFLQKHFKKIVDWRFQKFRIHIGSIEFNDLRVLSSSDCKKIICQTVFQGIKRWWQVFYVSYQQVHPNIDSIDIYLLLGLWIFQNVWKYLKELFNYEEYAVFLLQSNNVLQKE